MRKNLTQILSVIMVLLIAVILQSFGTLALTDLGTHDSSPKKIKEVVNANNTLMETAVNDNLATDAGQLLLFTAQTDTNAVAVDPTDTTPRRIGDKLIGTVSNEVWISKGVTVNDWVKASN